MNILLPTLLLVLHLLYLLAGNFALKDFLFIFSSKNSFLMYSSWLYFHLHCFYEFTSMAIVQLYGSGFILQKEYAIPIRSFAKEASPASLKGDGEFLWILPWVDVGFGQIIAIAKADRHSRITVLWRAATLSEMHLIYFKMADNFPHCTTLSIFFLTFIKHGGSCIF